MFKDRIFNISFLISLLFHLFCIFAFVLVVTPRGYTYVKFPEAAFLGPILEADAFSGGVGLKTVFMVTPYKEDFASNGLSVWRTYDYIGKNALLDESLDKTKFIEPDIDKQAPDFITK